MHLSKQCVVYAAAILAATLVAPQFAIADGEEGLEQGRRGRAQRPEPQMGPSVDVLIATSKPYDDVVGRVQAVGGQVRHEYDNIDAIAATIPVVQLDAFKAMPEIVAIQKDRRIELNSIRNGLESDALGEPGYTWTFDPSDVSGDIAAFTEVAPSGYFPVRSLTCGRTTSGTPPAMPVKMWSSASWIAAPRTWRRFPDVSSEARASCRHFRP